MENKIVGLLIACGISIIIIIIMTPMIFSEPNRDGIFPERSIKLVYSKDLRLISPKVNIFSNLDPNIIEFRFGSDIHQRTNWGAVAIILPYEGTLGKNSGWSIINFDKSVVLVKEYYCSESNPCVAADQDFVQLNLDKKIDKKQSYNHRVLFKFENSAPGEEYDDILSLNQNDEHYELGFSNLKNPKVVLFLDKNSDRIDTTPEAETPSSFSDKNLQRIWSIERAITYQTDYEVSSERESVSTLNYVTTSVAIIIGVVAFAYTVIFQKKHSTDLEQSNNSEPSLELRINHSKDLSDKIFKRLTNIFVLEENRELLFKIPVDQTWQNKTLEQRMMDMTLGTDVNTIKISSLNQTHLKWAFDHLKNGYQNIFTHWTNAERTRNEHNDALTLVFSLLSKYVCQKMKEEFPEFQPKGIEIELPLYNITGISRMLFSALASFVVGKERYNFGEFFNQQYGRELRNVLINSDGEQLIEYANKETFDIEKFRILMMKIYDEIELVKNCEILKKTLSETRNSILLFENELQTLVDEIDGGKPLEGACDLNY